MSTVLMILKPDVLAGAYAQCDGRTARDTARGLVEVYTGVAPTPYEMATSPAAVRWARRNIERKVAARSWYVAELHHRASTLDSIARHLRHIGDSTQVTDLILGLSRALGFTETTRLTRRCSHRDYLALYARNTHFSRLAADLHGYLVGQTVIIIRLDGDQEPTALHILKEVVRRVVRYPTTHYDALENLLHISDPGAEDLAYFEQLLSATGSGDPVSCR